MNKTNETICAIATVHGTGALSIIRLSGDNSFIIADKIFQLANSEKRSSKCISNAKSHTLHYGLIKDGDEIIDDVIVSVYHNPHSYTGEDSIEITCHGSQYIQQKILELLVNNGARLAKPGEYTMRAFLNNKLDLSQAEAVADLIASNSRTSHQLAISQMRGGFSEKIKGLRKSLVTFTSLLELELDFSEEDVEFADRSKLTELILNLKSEISILIESFKLGNVLKHGIPVAIIGKPNVGKSTLLNALLNEEKAIVSEIPGTTRDAIEDLLSVDGITFRFIDTAGLRSTEETIESYGIEKTYQKISQASVILYVFDINKSSAEDVLRSINELKELLRSIDQLPTASDKRIIVVGNKTDMLIESPRHFKELVELETIFVSAKRKENIKMLLDSLVKSVNEGITQQDSSIVSNVRHYEALSKSLAALNNAEEGIRNKLSSDLLSIDINEALYFIGEITGEVTSDEILDNIFRNFCIGK
jgi:tRNA modification GTPase